MLALSLASLPGAAQTAAAPATPDSASKKPETKSDSAPAKAEFKPSWNFSAWLFGEFQYETDSATKANNGGNPSSKFTVDRAYLTFRGMVAPAWGFRVTTDVVQSTGAGTYQGLIIRLKYAYMQWDYLRTDDPNDWSAWARIGQIQTVIIEEEERFWPRWLQKTPIEYWGFQNSSDLGASTQFTLPDKLGIAYFTVGNGGGYTVPETDRYKDAALRLTLTPLTKSTGLLRNLAISGWYYAGLTQAAVATQPGLTRDRYGVVAEAADPRFTWGVEWLEGVSQVDSIGPPYGRQNVVSPLVDGFVIVRPFLFSDPKGVPLAFIARYDRLTPNNASATSARNETFMLLGAFYDVAKSTSVGITYQQTTPNAGATLPYKTEIQTWNLNWQLTF